MGEIHITFKIPEGEPVKGGQIPTYISPDAIEAVISRDPVFVYNPEFSDYFHLRLAEHGLAYEDTKSSRSAERDEELKSILESITEIEEENPTFQGELTHYLNSIIDKYR